MVRNTNCVQNSDAGVFIFFTIEQFVQEIGIFDTHDWIVHLKEELG